MEIKNQTSYTYDAIMDYNRRHMRGLRITLRILLLASAVSHLLRLCETIILFFLKQIDTIEVTDISFPLSYLFWILLFLILPPISRRINCRKQASTHMSTEYTFTEDHFSEMTTTDAFDGVRNYKYKIITKVTESDRAFYLYISPNTAHIVSKNGFTEGNENDFRTLLRTMIEPQKLHIQ